MGVNPRFLPHFVLVVTLLYGVLSGIFILRSKEVRKPFSRDKYIQGKWAIVVGMVMLLVGLGAGCLLIAMVMQLGLFVL